MKNGQKVDCHQSLSLHRYYTTSFLQALCCRNLIRQRKMNPYRFCEEQRMMHPRIGTRKSSIYLLKTILKSGETAYSLLRMNRLLVQNRRAYHRTTTVIAFTAIKSRLNTGRTRAIMGCRYYLSSNAAR